MSNRCSTNTSPAECKAAEGIAQIVGQKVSCVLMMSKCCCGKNVFEAMKIALGTPLFAIIITCVVISGLGLIISIVARIILCFLNAKKKKEEKVKQAQGEDVQLPGNVTETPALQSTAPEGFPVQGPPQPVAFRNNFVTPDKNEAADQGMTAQTVEMQPAVQQSAANYALF